MIRKNYLQTIRKILKLNQNDITNGKVTRITISHIENHRIALTDKTISVILETVNAYLKAHNFIIRLEYDDLFTENRFLKKYDTENIIKRLEKSFIEDCSSFETFFLEISSIFTKWNFPRLKVHVFYIWGDYLYSIFEYSRSIIYYRQILSIISQYGSINDIAKSTIRLMRAEIKLNEQYTVIESAQEIQKRHNEVNKDLLLGIIFNLSLIYKNQGNYQDALNELDKLDNLIPNNDTEKISDILLVKALCYVALERYIEADSIYSHLILLLSDDIFMIRKANVYCNMLSLYIQESNYTRIAETIYSLFLVLPQIPTNNTFLTGIYLEIANSYNFMSEYDLAYKYYRYSIDSAQLTNKRTMLSDALLNYIELFYKLNKTDVNNITQLIISLLSSNKIKLDNRAIFKYLLILNSMEQYDEGKILLKHIDKIETRENNEV